MGRDKPLKNYALAMDLFSKFGYDFSNRFGFYGLLKLGFILALGSNPHVLPELDEQSHYDIFPFVAGGFLASGFGFELFFNKWLGSFLEFGVNQYLMSYRYYVSSNSYHSLDESQQENRLSYFLRSYYIKFGLKTTF